MEEIRKWGGNVSLLPLLLLLLLLLLENTKKNMY